MQGAVLTLVSFATSYTTPNAFRAFSMVKSCSFHYFPCLQFRNLYLSVPL